METQYQKIVQEDYDSLSQKYQIQEKPHRIRPEPGFKAAWIIWQEIKKLEKSNEL